MIGNKWDEYLSDEYKKEYFKDLLEFVRKLGKIRNTEKFLETADLDIIDINDKYFMFTRSKEDEGNGIYSDLSAYLFP